MTQQPSPDELRRLLPFYVNGTLSEEERGAVENWLAESAEARGELAFLETLRGELRRLPAESSPGELGLKRLQREIAHERGEAAGGDAAAAAEQARRAQESARRGVAPWWRGLAIAACLALAVLAGLRLAEPPGGESVQLAGGGPEAEIQVAFRPTASEQAIRELLLEIDATIVDGPSALGLYRLGLAPDGGAAAVERAIEQLRARPDVVESVARE